jgi:hypothetical protein
MSSQAMITLPAGEYVPVMVPRSVVSRDTGAPHASRLPSTSFTAFSTSLNSPGIAAIMP